MGRQKPLVRILGHQLPDEPFRFVKDMQGDLDALLALVARLEWFGVLDVLCDTLANGAVDIDGLSGGRVDVPGVHRGDKGFKRGLLVNVRGLELLYASPKGQVL